MNAFNFLVSPSAFIVHRSAFFIPAIIFSMRLLPVVLLAAVTASAQHDITKVEPAPTDAAVATPGPRKPMKKYDVPDLAGARQALGSQLIDGRLPRPLIDYLARTGEVAQRVSIFEGGLVVLNMTGASAIRKKVLIPADAVAAYRKAITAEGLGAIDPGSLPHPEATRYAQIRAYAADGTFVERVFDPGRVNPKGLEDKVAPMRDLLRAISEDRDVTTSLAGYEPRPGDELVADDQKIYRVIRIVDPPGVVELKCLTAPTTIYVAKKDLKEYFVGARPREQ